MATISDRIRGCLLYGALGDAIGAAYEGGSPSRQFEIPPQLDVTDDTQLTLATCEAIVEAGGVNPESIANCFLRWYRERRLKRLGSSTLMALTQLDVGGHWATVGATGERSAGNGAAMRIAPLAFFLDPDQPVQRQTIRDVCRITHRNDEAYLGALAVLCTIRCVVSGMALDKKLVSTLVGRLPDSRVRDRLIAVGESSVSMSDYLERFASTAYVVDSVPLAIVAAMEGRGFQPTVADIVKCGGDTDTVASMFGHIFGAAHGIANLPGDLTGKLDVIRAIEELANPLASLAFRSSGDIA